MQFLRVVGGMGMLFQGGASVCRQAAAKGCGVDCRPPQTGGWARLPETYVSKTKIPYIFRDTAIGLRGSWGLHSYPQKVYYAPHPTLGTNMYKFTIVHLFGENPNGVPLVGCELREAAAVLLAL
jgi:hypothetical protein